MSRINDFSFLFKEPSEAHRVAPCGWVCVCGGEEGRGEKECVYEVEKVSQCACLKMCAKLRLV